MLVGYFWTENTIVCRDCSKHFNVEALKLKALCTTSGYADVQCIKCNADLSLYKIFSNQNLSEVDSFDFSYDKPHQFMLYITSIDN